MIYQLDKNQYEKVRRIFEGLSYHLVIYSIIEGNSPGMIFVDNAELPEAAFAWDQVEGGYYLAGTNMSDKFAGDLNKLIRCKIREQARDFPHLLDFTFNGFPAGWEDRVDIIFKNISTLKHYRKHFTFKKKKISWHNKVPAGFVMQQVDQKLLQRDDLINIDKIREWVFQSWQSVENFRERGVGVCLLYKNAIVSWSIGDFTAGGDYEIGIHTDPGYRRRGYATLTVLAAVENCLSRGANNIGWHCWSENTASAATALKAGFEQTVEHPVYHAWYNCFDNLLVQAHFYFQWKEYEKAAGKYESAYKMRKEGRAEASVSSIFGERNREAMCWYEAARAFAAIGETKNAFQKLKAAIKAGFSDIERIMQDDMLESIPHNKQWERIMRNIS